MSIPRLTDDLRAQVQGALAAARDAQEAQLIRDIALVLCGARPAAYVWEAGQAIEPLIAAAAAAGFPTNRWDDDDYGWYAAIALRNTTLEEMTDLAQREVAGPLLPRDEADLGELLGYPAPSVVAYVRTAGGRKAPMLSEVDWTPDERRFLLCLHGADAASAAVGRAWTDGLLAAFREAYGDEAVASLPVAAAHQPR